MRAFPRARKKAGGGRKKSGGLGVGIIELGFFKGGILKKKGVFFKKDREGFDF